MRGVFAGLNFACEFGYNTFAFMKGDITKILFALLFFFDINVLNI